MSNQRGKTSSQWWREGKARPEVPTWPSWAIVVIIVSSYVVGRTLVTLLGDVWGWVIAFPISVALIIVIGHLWIRLRRWSRGP